MLALNRLTRPLLDLLFAEECPGCGVAAVEGLCPPCRGKVAMAPRNVCALCGTFLEFDYAVETGQTYRCGACRHVTQSPYDELKSALRYEGSGADLIRAFKFRGRRRLAAPLAQLGEEVFRPWIDRHADGSMIAVPMSRNKTGKRGFNPAWLIAHEYARMAAIPLLEATLIRTRDTKPQYGLNHEEREKNVRGAFAVERPEQIAGKKIILFDDVHTTGATVRECCKALRNTKPASIVVFTLFRA